MHAAPPLLNPVLCGCADDIANILHILLLPLLNAATSAAAAAAAPTVKVTYAAPTFVNSFHAGVLMHHTMALIW